MKKEKRLVAYAVCLFLTVLAVGLVMLGDAGLRFFNILFGWDAYALEIRCQPRPDYAAGKIISVGFNFDIRLTREKIAVEALSTGYRVKELSGENLAVSWKLHVFAYALNRVKLYDRTFTFDTLNPRLIIVYLRDIPAEARQVCVEIDGSYTLNGEEIMFSNYGGAYALEA
jgi:hypothetical protein